MFFFVATTLPFSFLKPSCLNFQYQKYDAKFSIQILMLITFFLFSVDVGSHPVMSSPDDRAGLLDQAEPIDYKQESWGEDRRDRGGRGGSDKYGSQAIREDGGKYSSGTGRKSNHPPRGLFDDI